MKRIGRVDFPVAKTSGLLRRLLVGSAAFGLFLAWITEARSLFIGAASAQAISQSPTIRLDVSEVLVPVTVTDSEGHYITGLRKQHFQLWEDKVEQTIEHVFTEDAPMSLGIILDTSKSMTSTIRTANRNVQGCLKASDLTDEFFLVLFSSEAQSATPFTSDIRQLQNMLLFLAAKGSTALYDAVYNGLVRIKEGRNPRKALVIASDGAENNSRHHGGEIKNMAKELDVQVFTIGNAYDGTIREMTQITGGRSLEYAGLGALGDICTAVV